MFKGITSIVLIVFFCFNLVPVVQCQTQEQEVEGEEIGYIKKFKKGQLEINGVKEEKKDQALLRVRNIIKTLKSEATIELINDGPTLTVKPYTKVEFFDWNIPKLHEGNLRVESKDKWEWFSVEEDDLVGELDEEKILGKLREELEFRGITLPASARPKGQDPEWTIEWEDDNNIKQEFTVCRRREKGKLKLSVCPTLILLSECQQYAPEGTDFLISVKDDKLFSVKMEAQWDLLNNGIISADLQQAFKDNESLLSKDAFVSVKETDVKWLITDGDKVYTVKKQEGELNIYTTKTITAVAKGEVSLRPLKPGSAEEILGQKTISEKRGYETVRTRYLPKTSKAWKWGMLGGSAVALGGLAYVAHRLISKDSKISESFDEISGLSDKNMEEVVEIRGASDDLSKYAGETKDNVRIIRDSLDKIVRLSTGQARNEASTGEAPGGTAGIPCEGIFVAIEEIGKAAGKIDEAAEKIDKVVEPIDRIDKNSTEITEKAKDSKGKVEDSKGAFIKRRDFLATAAGIGVVASIVLILLHDVYAGVDDSEAFLLMEPELNRQHAGIKLGVKQRF